MGAGPSPVTTHGAARGGGGSRAAPCWASLAGCGDDDDTLVLVLPEEAEEEADQASAEDGDQGGGADRRSRRGGSAGPRRAGSSPWRGRSRIPAASTRTSRLPARTTWATWASCTTRCWASTSRGAFSRSWRRAGSCTTSPSLQHAAGGHLPGRRPGRRARHAGEHGLRERDAGHRGAEHGAGGGLEGGVARGGQRPVVADGERGAVRAHAGELLLLAGHGHADLAGALRHGGLGPRGGGAAAPHRLPRGRELDRGALGRLLGQRQRLGGRGRATDHLGRELAVERVPRGRRLVGRPARGDDEAGCARISSTMASRS